MSDKFYKKIQPIESYIETRRRTPLHPYFTSQPSSLIQAYISNFCAPEGTILDLFGGSGTTIREAVLAGRRGLYIDINPWSCFIAKQSVVSPDIPEKAEPHFQRIKSDISEKINDLYKMPQGEVEGIRLPESFPSNIRLPANSDVETLGELFTPRNKVAIIWLKEEISKVKNISSRNFLLFVFSGILARGSRTYWKDRNRKGGGDSGIYKVYRYWIPKQPDERNIWELFEARFKRVSRLVKVDNEAIQKKAKFYCSSATNAREISSESVDYIYTDPPYAKHIPYLDLSTMYNSLLGFNVTKRMKANEVIEGGEQGRSMDDYLGLMEESFREAYRVLKRGRWMTLVFTHKDPSVFDRIVSAAVNSGFEFVNAVAQDTRRPSFHKTNNSVSVLKGQMMLNFLKPMHKSSQLSLFGNTEINLEEFLIDEVTFMLKIKKGGVSYSDIVHKTYEKVLAKGYIQNFSRDLKCIFETLDKNFESMTLGNDVIFTKRKRPGRRSAGRELVA